MRTRTLAELRADARVRADMVGSTLLSDGAVNELVNQSIAKVYRAEVAARGHGYYVDSKTYTTIAGTTTYLLPYNFWQLQTLDVTLGGQRQTLRPFEPKERAEWSATSVPAGIPLILTYIPAPQRLAEDGQSWDGIAGWEEAVVLDTAIKMLQIEESDPSILAAQLADEMRNISLMAGDRDTQWTSRVVDVRRGRRGLDGRQLSGSANYLPRYRVQGANLEILWGPAGVP